MKIAITGGAGYVGSQLVPYLLSKGHQITVLDTFWFGDHLPADPNLIRVKGDIRNTSDLTKAFKGQEAVIHLACVSNDPSFDMNPDLGQSINYTCFKNILKTVKNEDVKRFIYASSSSVYGISDDPNVTEDTKKKPLTDYSKFKLACEMEIQAYGCGGTWTIVRPATVCGYAFRQRLDLVVNTLTIQALVNKRITMTGREQKRPNINIMDMCRAYDFILNEPEVFMNKRIYNVGFENLSLIDIANLVKSTLDDPKIEIVEIPNDDPRSYHINSDKFLRAGFEPMYSVKQAIQSIQSNYRRWKDPINNPEFYNIKKMGELRL